MNKSWTVTYSKKEGYTLVVYLSPTNQVWALFCDALQWSVHHLFCFVPMLPFPIIHWRDKYCSSFNLHFHFSYSWFGKSWEGFLCSFVCLMGDDYLDRKVYYEHPLTAEELEGFSTLPAVKSLVEDIKDAEK